MARARNIKPGFFRNENLVELPYETRLLFIGLWTIADREGRLEDRPKRIKMELFPADDLNVDVCLQQLHDGDFVLRYKVEDARYVQVLAFSRHQNPHQKEQASIIPAPDLLHIKEGDAPDMPDASTGQAPDKPGLFSDSLNTDSPLSETPFSDPEDSGADAPGPPPDPPKPTKPKPTPAPAKATDPMPRNGEAQILVAVLYEDVLGIGKPTNYGRTVGDAQKLVAAGCTPEELTRIAHWLMGDPWIVDKGITMGTVIQQRDKWRASQSKPASLTVHQGGRTSGNRTNATGSRNLTNEELLAIARGESA